MQRNYGKFVFRYVILADLGLDFCSQPVESLQKGFVLWLESGASLHIFESHVQFSELLQSLTATVQGFNVGCIFINCCGTAREEVRMNSRAIALDRWFSIWIKLFH